ncbi:MAG: hypothetical protein KUG81_03245, partial [Gammaproteobacteria bacterium]|nr:hypothetical protein [Gammaproteobacteria bacterium]
TLSNYVRPSIVENKSKNWVLNGRNNSFYQYIIDRNKGSVTNSSINSTYNDLIYGKGLGSKSVNSEDWIAFKSILSDRDIRMIVSDFQLFGEATMQVIEDRKGRLLNIKHLAKNLTAPSIANEDNEIESYWVCQNWARTAQNTPEEFNAFGTKGKGTKIYNIKPYSQGNVYFSDPSYMSCLPYAEVEEETSNLYLNSIKQGLSAGYIINVPEGTSYTPEEKEEFERLVKQRLTGSSQASNFIISFNGADVEITVTPFPVNEQVHKQWSFLTEESKRQIMSAHRVISPSLIGLSTSSGFSSVADEMDKAEEQLIKRVIAPKQRFITDAIEEILIQYGINLNLFFKPLTEVKIDTQAQLSKHVCMSSNGATNEMADTLIEFGEDDSEDWQLLCSSEVDYDTDDDIYGLLQFATSTGVARPNAKSEQDNEDVRIRYRYVGNPAPQRDFCRKMMLANKLYRKEDILQMDKAGINDGFGLNGTNSYSIWLWKGGGKMSSEFPNGTCRHKWQREIYLNRKGGVDVNSPLAKTISTSEARRKGYKVPVNDSDVSVTPNRNKS